MYGLVATDEVSVSSVSSAVKAAVEATELGAGAGMLSGGQVDSNRWTNCPIIIDVHTKTISLDTPTSFLSILQILQVLSLISARADTKTRTVSAAESRAASDCSSIAEDFLQVSTAIICRPR